MGTPEFAVASLKRLVEDGHEICGVFTQPDRPKNRGHKLALSPVKEYALSQGLTVYQPTKMRDGTALALVRELHPAALVCVDSLCSAEPQRLGRTLQFSDTGLYPAQADHAKHLDAAALGVPVIAAGIPTLMDADEGADLVLTPRALDSVIAHGSALLAGILNRALQPRLSVAQLCWLTG